MNIIRPKNLLIVALTQYLLQYLVLVPALAEAGHVPLLSHWQFFWLVFDTMLIAAGGYIVNDIMDEEADEINRPERKTIGGKLSKNQAIGLYVFINLIGIEIAWNLAGQVGHRSLMLIYPAAVLLLYFYSKKWKAMPLIGNVVVAVFCAGVAGIVLFAERETYTQLSENQPIVFQKTTYIFGGYIVFAFVTTLLRELVKDLEDVEGDRAVGLRTLPVSAGMRAAKKWAFGVGLLLTFMTSFFLFWLGKNQSWPALFFAAILIFLPSVFLLKLMWEAKEKTHFSRLSRWVKWVMLAGLLLLVLLWV